MSYEECYEWVPYSSGDTADDRMIYTDDHRRMISRMQKYGNGFGCYFDTMLSNCYATTGHSLFRKNEGYRCQRLWIGEGCTIFWVPYIACDAIQPRAVIAGRMTNGDRVYVAKFYYNQPPVQSFTGHCVEGAANTFAPYGWVTRHSSTIMMMAVLHSPSHSMWAEPRPTMTNYQNTYLGSSRYQVEEVFPWFFLFKRYFHALVFRRMKSISN